MIHFNNTTGKNKGKLQKTKLANFLGKDESTLRALEKRNPEELYILNLGAICKVNSITEEDLEKLLKNK